MRPELEELQNIEDYLLNKLNKEAMQTFELKMQNDEEFAQKVEVQRILIQRIKHLSVRQSVAQSHRNYLKKQNFSFRLNISGKFYLSIFSISIVLIVAYLVFTSDDNKFKADIESAISGFKPPIIGVDVPFSTQSFNADSGAILHFNTGSMVRVTAGTFIDENGKEVNGIVELKFREFRDVADIFIAGIPMEYGQTYLESAAMSEVYAFKSGKPLKIKKGKTIEIIQSSYTASPSFNLYQFDKEKSIWIEKGKDTPIEQVKEIEKVKERNLKLQGLATYSEPVKPAKENPLKYSFTIETSAYEFPELEMYKNVKFEIHEDDTAYKPEHADILWEDVRLEKGNKPGTYKVYFTRKSRTVCYLVRPVFIGQDYEKALVDYKKKLDEYNLIKTQNLKNIKAKNDSINEKIKADQKKYFADKEQKKDQEIMDQKRIIANEINYERLVILENSNSSSALNSILAIEPTVDELIKNKELIYREYIKVEEELRAKAKIMRSYAVDGFGLWNSDRPIKEERQMVTAKFELTSDKIAINTISLVITNMRTIMSFNPSNMKEFGYYPGSGNILWTIVEGNKLVYYEKFDDLPLQANTNEYAFKMKEHPVPIETYEQARSIINGLFKSSN